MAPDNLFEEKYDIKSMRDFTGKTFYENMDSSERVLTGVYKPVRYSDYQSLHYHGASVITPINTKRNAVCQRDRGPRQGKHGQ